MNERKYLIEVLLRAREQVTQVAQKAVRALDEVTKSQDRMSESAKRTAESAREQRGALQNLYEAHVREKRGLDEAAAARRLQAHSIRESTDALREQARQVRASADGLRAQRDAAVKAQTESLREASSLRDLARARQDQVGAIDKTTRQLTQQAEAARRMADQNRRLASSYDQSIRAIERRAGVLERDADVSDRSARSAERQASTHERSSSRVARSIATVARQITDLDSRQSTTSRSTSRLGRVLGRLGVESQGARSSLRGLNSEFQGFQIALVIKYAQSLVSALIALAAQLVAVAAAAGQAAVGIGAALGAGMAQAIPVVGVLVAAFGRLTQVLKAVKLQNQEQLRTTHDAAGAARRQASAADSIRSAEQRVADAHRNTAKAVADLAQTRSDAAREEGRAQREVTQARKDAIRTVEDLIAAEKQAELSVESAQSALRGAISSGDVAGAAQATLDVSQARVGLRRARQDVAPVRARGVEGVDAVIQAEQRLGDVRRTNARQVVASEQAISDARRQERRATEDLASTRRTAADNLAQETAQVDKLADSLKLLSPAERELYRRILALQETYKRFTRPITDILVRAFTDVVDRTITILRDPRILRGFRGIAVQIAASIRSVTAEAGGRRSIGVFQILTAEAARNIPTVTRIAINFFRAVRNLVVDALPAFRLLLRYVEGYSKQALDASRHSRGIRDFFVTGVRYANSFFKLGLAVVRLLLAIAGRGGAAGEGIKTIDELARRVDGLTRKARDNAGSIRHFFAQTRVAFFEILGVVATLARTILSTFSPSAVKSFADFLNRVIIPALGNVLKIMGVLVTAFHQFASIPGVAQVLQFVATILLLARGLTVIQSAISSIMKIIPNFLRAMGLMTAAEEGAAVGLAAITPAGWVVLGIAALTAAIVLLDKKFHFLTPTLRFVKRRADELWQALKSGGRSVIKWLSDVWTQGILYWLRWPFVWAARHLAGPAFGWLIGAAKDAIEWFRHRFSGGGFWGHLGTVLAAPFRFLYNEVRLVFHLIRTLIKVFLDVLAGRFGRAGNLIKGFWNDLIGTLAGAVSSLLSVFQTLLGALGHIPKIGGPFKDAAEAIKGARESIDGWRDGLDKSKRSTDSATSFVDKHALRIVHLQEAYDVARDKQHKLKRGTDDYGEAARVTRRRADDLAEAVKRSGGRARDARRPVAVLRGNIEDLGSASQETTDAIVADLNSALRAFGAKPVRISVRRARRAVPGRMLGRQDVELATGGIPHPGSGSFDDHLLIDPYGRPVAAMSGTEGVVNRPQMAFINQLLGATSAMGMHSFGDLDSLWGSGMRHYQGGGGLQPAVRQLSSRLDRMFGLQTTSGYRTSMPLGHADYHNVGLAADVSGSPGAMERAVRFIMNSGLWRSLLEGIHNPGLSIKNGQRVPPSFWGSQWGQHVDHIHVALRSLSGVLADMAGTVRMPRITGPAGPLRDLIRGSARTQRRAANRYLERVTAAMGGADVQAMGADANVVSAFRRAITTVRSNRVERLALWEAGIVESGLRNLPFGDRDSLGALQERASIYGRSHALNPFASAVRFLTQARARRPWRGSAGSLAQAVQVSAFPGRYDAAAGKASRYLRGGGLLQRGGRFDLSGRSLRTSLAPAYAQMEVLGRVLSTTLESLARTALPHVKHFGLRVVHALSLIVDQNGLLDQLSTAVESIATRGAVRLQQAQFRITRRGPRRVYETPVQLARAGLQVLQETRGGLQAERGTIRDDLTAAQETLAVARRRGNTRAVNAAKAAIVNLRTRLDKVDADLAQNAQDQVEAQETFQQALLEAVNTSADRYSGALDRWSRTAKALGVSVDPNRLLGLQINNMRTQISGLQRVLARARRTGNVELARQVSEQIAELNTQIAEAVAQQFQNAVDAVNNEAQRQTTRLDRAARRAQLGGQTDYAAMQGVLQGRQSVLTTQRAGLLGLLGQAAAAGNVEQYTSLIDQIDELDTQLAENTQAIKDNTDAAFNFRTQQIVEAFGFAQTVFSGAQGFFQALGQRTGANTVPAQLSALQGLAGALGTQQGGLKGQLASLLGYTPQEAAQLAGLTGADLVSYVLSISSGPAFDAIMARLDPTQQASFKDLIGALLGNATAVESNTQAIQDLVGVTAQSFTSSFWTAFRTAIFTGSGGLLPQYRMTIPSAQVGGRITASGALMVHAGETVRPASISQDRRREGDVYNLNVTTPTQVLDPVDVGRQLSFVRRTSGR